MPSNILDDLEIKESPDIGTDTFQNVYPLWKDNGALGAYGGCLVSQSLKCCFQTLGDQFRAHSMHCSYLKGCDVAKPVVYKVNRVRDGRSFCTRIVEAYQDNILIFITTASFQVPAKDKKQVKHGRDFPIGKSLQREIARIAEENKQQNTPGLWKWIYGPFNSSGEIDKSDSLLTEERRSLIYLKTEVPPNDKRLNQIILAYFSDAFMMASAVAANDLNVRKDISMLVSLDHTIYFHEDDFDGNDGLLHIVKSPWTGDNRCVSTGGIYTDTGKLLASTMQEGVVRFRKTPEESKAKL